VKQWCKVLARHIDNIDATMLVGLEDRALISVMTFASPGIRRGRLHAGRGSQPQRQACVGGWLELD
jgi:hypothetical protein